ncbi:MFS transporter [Amycolatopsis rhabdoformis]|uniref:MFS transporter n=1 Tax=Amycolatopsis rhabdoformis TaxID=1448059 RepID=A0ABZ1ICY9_9PSEU|nr:MFS transporter [Amycolatopsis rhabdoformis]WSE32325.1 MFS transporter [Amycolatopsis rhabdoformis]
MARSIDPPQDASEVTPRRSARAILAGSAGTFIEWYDYGLYAYVAGIVFAPLFFPPGAGSAATIGTFGAFAAGFVARPIGGIVLGALSDRWGRRPVLLASIVLVGTATAAIGVLPPYAAVGVWSPVLLVLCRVAQGFGTGAEPGTAMVYVNESARPRTKGFQTSFLYNATMAGSILSLVFFAVINLAIGQAAFVAWGWRIPFLFAGVLTVIALILRRGMEETAEYQRVEEARARGLIARSKANPLAAVRAAFVASPRNYVAAFLMPTASNVIGYVANAFGISYMANQLKLSFSQTALALLVMYLAGVVALPLWGKACDRWSAKTVLLIGAVAGILLAFPYFALLGTRNMVLVVIAGAVLWAACWSPSVVAQLVIGPVLFRTESRAAGFTSSRELQQALVAGPTPLLAAALIIQLDGAPWLVAGLILVAQVVTVFSIKLGRPQLSAAEIGAVPAHRGLAVAEPAPAKS